MKALSNSRLAQRLRYAKHGVIALVGTGQYGKTVTTHALLEAFFPDRTKAMIGYPEDICSEYLSSDFRSVQWPKDINDFPDLIDASSDVVVIDDAAFIAGARDHNTKRNKDVQKILTIASHHELFIMLTVQNFSLLDFATLQSQDVYIIHKRMDLLGLQFERDEMMRTQVIANLQLQQARISYPELHPKGLSYCSTTHEILYNRLPDYWTEALSKPFKGVIPGG